MLTTVLAFAFTLGLLIVVHEYGHYRVARACGVRVLRFSVGFGPVLWRRVNAEGVEFTLSALPLGGYVRMLDSREAPVPESLLGRAFDRQPLRRRVAIVAAGPLANLALAVLLYAGAGWWGAQEPQAVLATPRAGSLAAQAGVRAGDRVLALQPGEGDWRDVRSLYDVRRAVQQAVLDGQALQLELGDRAGGRRHTVSLPLDRLAGRDLDAALMREIGIGAAFTEAVIGTVQPGGPAAQAGLRTGDRVLAVDEQPVADAQALIDRIRAAGRWPVPAMHWQVERAQQRLFLVVEPRREPAEGGPVGRIDAFIGQPPATVEVRLGPLEGLHQGARQTLEAAWTSLRMIGRMVIGQASLRQLSGPLTIADYAGQSVQLGVAYYLGFLAMISVSLGVLNLLPLPMLDGGHLLYYLHEGVTGRPVPDRWQAWLQRGGAVVLLLMMFIALSNDVARLLGLQ